MKNFILSLGLAGVCLCSGGAFAISAGTVSSSDNSRSVSSNLTSNTNLRGNQNLANAYRNNQRNNYYIINQLDVETACQQKVYNCLAEYCGDTSIVPGVQSSRCTYSTETELYNYALLCLQKDTEVLVAQYANNTRTTAGGTNTAARLCPSYVQQGVLSYLSMANMANQLSKSHSDLCLQRRQELEAAMSCHSIALSYGNETSSMLTSQLTAYCGSGVPGGSAEMVTQFANAGNVGANIWAWADKVVNLDLNKKGDNWEAAVDAILATYTNRMNLACGDNMQLNTVSHPTTSGNTSSTLTTVASMVLNTNAPTTTTTNNEDNWSVYMEVTSLSEIYKYSDAYQVVQAAMQSSPTTANAFLNSAQISDMQNAYARGTKLFVIRDSTRCYMVPVATMTDLEQRLVAQTFANCISK